MKQTDRIDRCGGIGTKTMQQFQTLGVETAGDLLRYYPVRYEFFGNPIPLEEAGAGNVVTIRVIPEGRPQNMRNSRMQMISVWAGDGTGRIRLNWYHMPYVIYRIKKGQTYFFRGTLIRDSFGLSMNQPDIWEPEEYQMFAGRLQASYALVKGLSRNRVQKALTQILDEAEDLSDELPAGIRKAYDLPDWIWAVRQIHFPESTEALSAARRRLVFDEFFLFILGIRQMKNHQEFHENPFHFEQHAYADRLLAGLPYRLTGDQQRTLEEIRRDLRGDHLMNRLVQGDVGSGKTILAMLALTETAENGWQGALMAPTEVLARQHAQSFREMYERREIPFQVELLTGSMTAAEKRKAYQRIADHKADIIIG
ncbi:MAG: DEAD/DEAH box helicase, partial [Lachnospiraceae bacterium]